MDIWNRVATCKKGKSFESKPIKRKCKIPKWHFKKYPNNEKFQTNGSVIHNCSHFSQLLYYMHYQQYGLNQHLNQWEERLDEEIPQDHTRNQDNGRHSITTTKYYQTSRDGKYTTSRNRGKHLTSKWQLQNTNGRRYIQHIRGFMKHYPRRHREPNIPYPNASNWWTELI